MLTIKDIDGSLYNKMLEWLKEQDMKVTYKVIDTRTNEDITNKYDWVIQPNGRLAYNAYGDLIGLTYAEAVFSVEQKQGKWILNHGIIDYSTCSCCGSMISQSQLNRYYCPACGAKMNIEECSNEDL